MNYRKHPIPKLAAAAALLLASALPAAFAQQTQTRYAWSIEVDDQDGISRFDGSWARIGGQLVQVSVANDNTVVGVSRGDVIWRWTGENWQQLPGLLTNISAGSANEIWGVSRANEVWRWNTTRNDWDKMPGVLKQISVSADGAVWGVDLTNNPWLWTGTNWQMFNCKVKQLAAGDATNVWAVGENNEVLRYSTMTGTQRWDAIGGQQISQISVAADGEVWARDLQNNVIRWNGSGWTPMNRRSNWISVGPQITAPGPFTFYGNSAWLLNGTPDPRRAPQQSTCPPGWRLPSRSELEAVLQFSRTQPEARSLTAAGGFNAKAGEAYVSSTVGSVFYKYFALFTDQAAVAPVNTFFPSSADASDGTLAANAVMQRCIRQQDRPVQSATAGCSVQFGASPDVRTIDFNSIQTVDLARTTVRPHPFWPTALAPITVNPQGGGLIYYVSSTDNRGKLLEIDAAGRPGAERDLGPSAGAAGVGIDGANVAYLNRPSANRLEFQPPNGAAPAVIMDNDLPADGSGAKFSGRGIRWQIDGRTPFGTSAMGSPVNVHRAVVLAAGGNWFAAYDHNNNFNAETNPAVNDTHLGSSVSIFNADGSNPRIIPWIVSHSLDMRMFFDGTRVMHAALGDAFPMDIRVSAINPTTGASIARNDLFASAKFPDTQMGTLASGAPEYGIAANGGMTSAGMLGDFLQMGCGQYVLTYAIAPATYTFQAQRTTTVNELGMMVIDQDLNVIKRAAMRRGDDVEFLKSARIGKSAVLVAWKTKNAEDYWAAMLDVRGVMIQSPQKLPAGVRFGRSDGFVTMANGDVMWTAADASNKLTLYRLPQPAQ